MIDLAILDPAAESEDPRAALAPPQVAEFIGTGGRRVAIAPAPGRVFADGDYAAAGAVVTASLAAGRVCVALAPPPLSGLPRRPLLAWFRARCPNSATRAHLKAALAARTTLVDAEAVVDRYGRRLLDHGRFAGAAGLLDALATLGARLAAAGEDTPLAAIRPAREYGRLSTARAHLANEIAPRLRAEGLPASCQPLVVGITGGGPVARGAEEVLDLLPRCLVDPDELPELTTQPGLSRHVIHRAVFRRHQRVRFVRHLPHLTVLANALPWEPGDPRLFFADDLRELTADGPARLQVIADLAAQEDGALALGGASGANLGGISLLSVDGWAAAFPRESTECYGDSLYPLLTPLLEADWTLPFDRLRLPAVILGAIVTHRGELAPRFRHLTGVLR